MPFGAILSGLGSILSHPGVSTTLGQIAGGYVGHLQRGWKLDQDADFLKKLLRYRQELQNVQNTQRWPEPYYDPYYYPPRHRNYPLHQYPAGPSYRHPRFRLPSQGRYQPPQRRRPYRRVYYT